MTLEARFPRTPSHPTTEEGKACHWACDRVLASWSLRNASLPLTLASFRGQRCPENGLVVTDEMIEGGAHYLEAVWARSHGHIDGMKAEVQLSAHGRIEKLAGRADAIWRSPDRRWLTVWDFKFGYTPVDAYMNWQLLSYALGAVVDETETIELVVVQPRGQSVTHPIKTWIVSRADFEVHAAYMVARAANARSDAPEVVAGKHCNYCRAAGNCETLEAAGYAALERSGAPVVVEMDENQIAFELDLLAIGSEQNKARTRALEALATSRIETGLRVRGFGVTRTQGNRRWTMDPAKIIAFGQLYGVDLSVSAPVSPAQAEHRGLPADAVNMFTERNLGAAKLRRVKHNEDKEIMTR